MELVTIRAKSAGKNSREIEYQGIGKFVPVLNSKGEATYENEVDDKGKDTGKPKIVDGKAVPVLELQTEGCVTTMQEALSLVKNDLQTVLDYFAQQYNRRAYFLAGDALADYIEPSWSTEKAASFRLIVNNAVKMGTDLEKAVAAGKMLVGA